jgi:type III secretory pathway component EscU
MKDDVSEQTNEKVDSVPVPQLSNQVSMLQSQIPILAFTLIINLGFYKVSEINGLMVTIANMIKTPTLFAVTIIGGAVILYFIYVVSIGLGLYQVFQGKPVNRHLIFSLGSFFMFYILLLIYQLNKTTYSGF